MNPYWHLKKIIAEPLRLSGLSKKSANEQAAAMLARDRLSAE
ncbi:hypothetical protein [Paenibacillus lycopersici]|nr:hypothetical protein [Paenibacillus lycopersici]